MPDFLRDLNSSKSNATNDIPDHFFNENMIIGTMIAGTAYSEFIEEKHRARLIKDEEE